MRHTIGLDNAEQGYAAVLALWRQIKPLLVEGRRLLLTVRTDTRSQAQNRIMWSCMTDLSEQVMWHGKFLKPEGWKDFITAHLTGQELVPNMDGTGYVALWKGRSTSDMTIGEMVAVVDLCHAFGSEEGVVWKETSLGREAAPLRAAA